MRVTVSILSQWMNGISRFCGSICYPFITLVFLALVGWFGLEGIKQDEKVEMRDQLKLILNTNVTATKNWIDLRKSEVTGWANYKDAHQELLNLIALASQDKSALLQSRELKALRERFGLVCKTHGFLGFVVFDKSGEQVGALYDEAVGRDSLRALSDFVPRSLQGETVLSRPFLATILLPREDDTLGRNQPTMFASTPIYDNNEIVGVFAFRIRPAEITRILESARSGKTGETYAFDSTGLMISDSRFNEQLKKMKIIPDSPHSRAILTIRLNVPGENHLNRMAGSATKGLSGIDVDGYLDYRGTPVIGAWTWLPEQGFGVATEIDTAEAYKMFSNLRALFLILYILLAMATLFNLVLRKREMRAEEMRELILNCAGEGIYGLDANGIFTFVNPATENMFRYTADELVGKSAHALIHHSKPDGTPYPEEQCHIYAAFRDGSTHRVSNDVFWRKDGTGFPVEYISTPIKKSGKLSGAVITFKDTTELTQAEAEREHIRQIMRIFIEHNPVPVAMFDRDMRYLAYSRRWLTDYNLGSEDITGRPHYEVFPEITERWKEIHRRCLAGAVEKCEEDTFYRADGAMEWLRWEITPWRDKKGQIGGIIMFTEVITEHKKIKKMLKDANEYLELKIQERTAELSLANERLRQLSSAAEQSPSSIMITDLAGNIEYVNPKFTQLSGYTPDEVLGRNPRILKSGKTPLAEYKTLWNTISTGGEWRGEFFNRKKDGGSFWGYASISPIKDQDGKITNFISSMEDITERKLAEEKLKESLLEKEVLLREINHRAKNNMQVISSLIKMQSKDSDDPKFANLLQNLGNRIAAMNIIHDQIFQTKDLNRINTSRYIINLSKNILASYGENGGKIALNCDTGDISLDVDTSVHCGLIINELVSNCLKHAFAPGQEGVIDVALHHTTNGDIELIVSDNGLGIKEAIDIHKVRSLGMRLVVSLGENQLHGKIDVNRNNGTEFKILFPAQNGNMI